MDAKVSIVVPVYKIPIYALESCVNSLKNQEYSNCEMLLIDDGSPDNCGNVCDTLAKSDNRIKVFHKQNAGVSEARNTGIKESTGDYIMFVDGDDCLHPKAVSMMIETVVNNHLDIALCDYKRFYSQDPYYSPIENNCAVRIFESEADMVILKRKCLHEDNVYNIRFNGAPWGKIFSNDLIKKNKVLFDSSLIRSQDNHFNFRVFGVANNIGYINEKLYYYRQLQGSSVNRYRSNLYEISNLYIDRITKTINETEDRDEYVETLFYVKIEKMLELCSNYSRSPKQEKKVAVSYVKEARNNWMKDLTVAHLMSMQLNALEKFRIYLVLTGCYNSSLRVSELIRFLKLKMVKFRV